MTRGLGPGQGGATRGLGLGPGEGGATRGLASGEGALWPGIVAAADGGPGEAGLTDWCRPAPGMLLAPSQRQSSSSGSSWDCSMASASGTSKLVTGRGEGSESPLGRPGAAGSDCSKASASGTSGSLCAMGRSVEAIGSRYRGRGLIAAARGGDDEHRLTLPRVGHRASPAPCLGPRSPDCPGSAASKRQKEWARRGPYADTNLIDAMAPRPHPPEMGPLLSFKSRGCGPFRSTFISFFEHFSSRGCRTTPGGPCWRAGRSSWPVELGGGACRAGPRRHL